MFDTVGSLFNANSYANLGAGSMVAGALLVSSPIIIHLINRMRFQRIRWAAMEFLIKAQKRMRRKMIIEQLLLLLLRILIMLLIGLLFARFLGFNTTGEEARQTAHVVLIDDSPSMGDAVREDGVLTNAYESGKKLIHGQIVPAASEATTPQFLDIMTTSQLDQPLEFNRLSSTSAAEIKEKMNLQELSTVRVPMHIALRRAADYMNRVYGSSDTARVLHVISDFRSPDWTENVQAIKDTVKEINDSRITIQFIDAASPYRKDEKRSPRANDNLAITDLQPAKPVAAKHEPIEFTMRVHNFGTSEMTNRLIAVKVNGDETKVPSRALPTLLPGQTHIEKFMVPFDRVASPDKPFDRFSIVTAGLATEEEGGLEIDNVRHAVVEVRDRLPILVLDGNPELRNKNDGNSLYLERYFLGAGGGYQWVPGVLNDLEKPDLAKYAFILVLNVPTIPEAARIGLEKYIRGGGGCAFFMGPNIKPADYNSILYRSGEGCFPVPLPDNPTKELTPDEYINKKFNSFSKKLLVRDPASRQHPALLGLYTDERGRALKDFNGIENFYRFIGIFRYWPVKRPGQWTSDPNVRELFCMPNEEPMKNYESASIEFAKKIEIPAQDASKEVDFLFKALTELKEQIPNTARQAKPLSDLSMLLDRLLADQQYTGSEEELALRNYWAQSKNADLRDQLVRLRDAVKYGDPFYLAKDFGKGRVITILTSPGEVWTNWASEKPGSNTFAPIIKEMTNYLSSGASDTGILSGEAVPLRFAADGYKPEYRTAFTTHKHDPKSSMPVAGVDPAPITESKNEMMEAIEVTEPGQEKTRYLVPKLQGTRKPGALLFEFKQLLPGATPNDPPTETLDYRATAVNIDALREGNLQRAATDDIKQLIGDVSFHSPDDKKWISDLKKKKSDISELGYVFALLLLVLVAEQALAVRLSYHSSADSMAASAPTVAAAMQKRMAEPAATA